METQRRQKSERMAPVGDGPAADISLPLAALGVAGRSERTAAPETETRLSEKESAEREALREWLAAGARNPEPELRSSILDVREEQIAESHLKIRHHKTPGELLRIDGQGNKR